MHTLHHFASHLSFLCRFPLLIATLSALISFLTDSLSRVPERGKTLRNAVWVMVAWVYVTVKRY